MQNSFVSTQEASKSPSVLRPEGLCGLTGPPCHPGHPAAIPDLLRLSSHLVRALPSAHVQGQPPQPPTTPPLLEVSLQEDPSASAVPFLTGQHLL